MLSVLYADRFVPRDDDNRSCYREVRMTKVVSVIKLGEAFRFWDSQ